MANLVEELPPPPFPPALPLLEEAVVGVAIGVSMIGGITGTATGTTATGAAVWSLRSAFLGVFLLAEAVLLIARMATINRSFLNIIEVCVVLLVLCVQSNCLYRKVCVLSKECFFSFAFDGSKKWKQRYFFELYVHQFQIG